MAEAWVTYLLAEVAECVAAAEPVLPLRRRRPSERAAVPVGPLVLCRRHGDRVVGVVGGAIVHRGYWRGGRDGG